MATEYMQIPVVEFEHLHAVAKQLTTAVHWNEERRDEQAREIERLRADVKELKESVEYWMDEVERLNKGWSDAEAQIAVLQDKLNWANVELTHRVGWEERALDAEAAVHMLRAQVIRLERDIEGFYEDERAKRS